MNLSRIPPIQPNNPAVLKAPAARHPARAGTSAQNLFTWPEAKGTAATNNREKKNKCHALLRTQTIIQT